MTTFSPLPSAGAVLVADDDTATRGLISRWLGSVGLRVIEATNGEEALRLAREAPESIDAIVLDVMMPGLTGFEVLTELQRAPSTAEIPTLLVTAHANEEFDQLRAIREGAADHISKPFRGSILAAKVQAACERRRAHLTLRERLKVAETHATTDPLTGLFNRRQFEQETRAEASHAKRHRVPFSLVLSDLDHFKAINDLFGHSEGDRVLRHVSELIRGALRPEDTAFRVGGEEFAILLRGTEPKGAVAAAERLRATLVEHPLDLGGEPRVVTLSAGVASACEANDFATDELVTHADSALYRAKRLGRDRVEAWT